MGFSSELPNPSAATLGMVGASAAVGQSAISVAAALAGILSSLMAALPIILGFTAVGLVMMIPVRYSDRALEQAELGMRGTVYPIYRDTIREVLNMLRRIYNPVICWFNALNWWGYSMVREVIFPTVRDCGIKPIFIAIGHFLQMLGEDIIVYFFTGEFWNGDADFSRVTPAGIAVFEAWIDLYQCSCHDLGDILKVIPIVSPLLAIPPAWPLILFSGSWTDPQTWCAISNGFNAAMAILREVLRLIQQVIYLLFSGTLPHSGEFIRPELREIVNRLCPAISCVVRSFENSIQLLWDNYVPFKFVFSEYLCIVDTLACILLKTVGLLFRILVNIDKAVIYPTDTFWETTIKQDVIEVMNLYVAPTNFPTEVVPLPPNPPRFSITSYFLNVTSQNTPLGKPNPLFGGTRLDECICNLITRTICDPSDENTGCYSQGAQNLLMGLDFCCLTNTLLILASDIVSGLFEFSLHLSKGPDDFFLFVDRQPFTIVLRDDLVGLVRCILSIFSLIPVVGPSIRDLILGIVRYLLSMIEFGFRVLIGLLTLPYFLIVLPSIPNFLTKANEANSRFIAIHDEIISDTPSSIKNALCVILNNGFPIPPIPCSNCVVGGYVPPPLFKRNMFDPETGAPVNSPAMMLGQIWGMPEGEEYPLGVTPLLTYGVNHTMNPFKLWKMAATNIEHMSARDFDFPNLRSVNSFVDAKRDELKKRWFEVQKCNVIHTEARQLAESNPELYKRNLMLGKYDCDPHEPYMPKWEAPLGGGRSGDSDGVVTELDDKGQVTTGPTLPTVIGCSNPTPTCFDLCCIVRSSLVLIVHTIQALSRFFNGIIQGGASTQGTTQDFPYFTGELEQQGKATFETDIVLLILYLFVPIKCACQVLNLIIPVTETSFTKGRPDICCFIQRVSELLAGIITVLINAIKSLALGSGDTVDGNYVYFRKGLFKADVNTLFDITLAVVECLCIFVRAIFPLDYIPGFSEAVNFDICCVGKVVLDTVIEIVRLVLMAIISIATITIDDSSVCFWRLDRTADRNCAGTLDGIGVIVQLDLIIDTFLPKHGQEDGQCLANCRSDNGATGIVPCICQIFNTLIPWRPFPNKPTNCKPEGDPEQNCQILDLCCPFSKIGFAIGDSLKFINRAIVSFWQSWDSGLPEYFVHYIWCDEGHKAPCESVQIIAPNACSQAAAREIPVCQGTYPVLDKNNTIQYRCGEFTCGKLNIVIDDLADPFQGLISLCICQIFSLLDLLISYIFILLKLSGIFPQAGWSCCFCGGLQDDLTCAVNKVNPCATESKFGSGSGVLPAVSYIVAAVLKAVIGLSRKFPLSCYWRPAYPKVPMFIKETWIFSFLAPTADALCIASGNTVCFANSLFLLPRVCLKKGQRFVGSIVRWIAEVIMRVVGFIEAFILSFIEVPNTCVGPNCDQKAGSKEQTSMGVSGKPLGNMLVILLSIPIDLVIGDADVSCTSICPSINANPTPKPCGCWNISPNYVNGGGDIYKWTTNSSLCLKPPTNEHIGLGYNDTSGCCYLSAPVSGVTLPSPMPICQSPDDAVKTDFTKTGQPGFPGYPGSCAGLSACRPDALPSAANDPETPIGLATNYIGALDGVVMGFIKYLRCLLSNLLGCDAMGKNCVPLGLIFYPAILIFSILWQILGGVVRFVAATLIFFFSLFTPPSGGECECWNREVRDAWNYPGTLYYRQVASLCYPCFLLRYRCDSPPPVGLTISDNTCSLFKHPCKPHCPIVQQQKAPLINASEAMARCIANYTDSQRAHPLLRAVAACSGHLNLADDPDVVKIPAPGFNPGVAPYYQPYPSYNPLNTTDGNTGLCNLVGNLPGFPNDQADRSRYALLDMCPDPWCQFNAPTQNFCGGDYAGFWPPHCGDANQINWFDCTYPGNPLVTCGGLQIISNFLDIFDAFGQIFTTPLLISPQSRAIASRGRFIGPVMRESRQAWNRRHDGYRSEGHQKRYSGLIYGMDATNGGPNMIELVADALYNYDTSDCYDDPLLCQCRNLDIPAHCSVDQYGQLHFGPLGRKRDGSGDNMTANDLIASLSETLFVGTTVCDHVVAQAANATWFGSATKEQKNQYLQCIDKKIQGSRMQYIADVVPDDIMYNTQAPLTLIHNIFHATRENIKRTIDEKGKSQKRTMTAREEMERKFPRFHEQLFNRSEFAKKVLIQDYGITPDRLMFDAAVKADAIWYKYETGFYSFALEKAMEGIAQGRSIIPTTQEALIDVRDSILDLRRVIINQPYQKLMDTTYEATNLVLRTVSDAVDEGVMTFIKRNWQRHVDFRRARVGRMQEERARVFEEGWNASPIVKWWRSAPKSRRTLAPFFDHMANVITIHRHNWETANFSFWNADIKLWTLKDLLVTRWSNPIWTPEKLDRYEKLKRAYYSVYDRIWPGTLEKSVQERFLFFSNCIILDRAVNISIRAIDYCANEAMPNLNFTRLPRSGSSAAGSWLDHSKYREGTHYNYHNQMRYKNAPTIPGDPHSWIRPHLIVPNSTQRIRVDHRAYRNALGTETHGPAGFNLYDWLLARFEDITGWAFGQETETWFEVVRQFIANPDTDIALYPDLGLAYSIRFPFICHFPESLNCSIGTGLETALLWVSVGFIALFVVSAWILPIATLPFQILGVGVSYVVVLLAVAWHYPPACFMMVPSFPLPFGAALPMCAMDELVAFFDKWITACYSPLILPPYMIAGPLCPTDPTQPIDVLNCRDIGVSDGLQNILYAGFWIFGQTFSDFVLTFVAVAIGKVIPGAEAYLRTTLDDFKNANPTHKERLTFCFWMTLPTVLLPSVAIFVGGIIVAALVPALMGLVSALVMVFFASPAAAIVPGADVSNWVGDSSARSARRGITEDEEEEEDAPLRGASSSTLRNMLRGFVFGSGSPKEKVE